MIIIGILIEKSNPILVINNKILILRKIREPCLGYEPYNTFFINEKTRQTINEAIHPTKHVNSKACV